MIVRTDESALAEKLHGLNPPDLSAFDANLVQPTELFVPKPEAAAEQFELEPSEHALAYAGAWRAHLLERRGAQRYYRDADISKCCPFAPTRLVRDVIQALFPDEEWNPIWNSLEAGEDREFLEQYEQLLEAHLSHWASREKLRNAARHEAHYRLLVARHLLHDEVPGGHSEDA